MTDLRTEERAGKLRTILLLALWLCVGKAASGNDWPMWRYDASRSAAAVNNELPEEPRLLWERTLTPRRQAWDDPLNLNLMTYDRVFEPIVMNGRMFVDFNDRDKLAAIDTETGEERWSSYADAPVRLPPDGWAKGLEAGEFTGVADQWIRQTCGVRLAEWDGQVSPIGHSLR